MNRSRVTERCWWLVVGGLGNLRGLELHGRRGGAPEARGGPAALLALAGHGRSGSSEATA
eukprot:7358568-Alexandrium_andersonii.AAC.1